MPIKRLRQDTASFPIIGKLRKGDKKPNGNQPGKDLDYFRFDTDDTDAMSKFVATYGNEPKAITVYLPFHTIEENFTSWQEEYSAGGLKHRCDGETCVIWQKSDGTYSREPKPCPGNCKEVGRLTVIIPELMRFAYVSVETHSLNDIMQITRNLNAAFALRGDLTGIPFLLIRRPVDISTPGKDGGKRVRRTKALLFLEPHPEWVQVRLLEMRKSAIGELPSVTTFKQLTSSVDMETGEVLGYVDEGDDSYDNEEIEGYAPEEENPFKDTLAGATVPAKRLANKINLLFKGDAQRAGQWLILRYTRRSTPDNVRGDISALTGEECEIIGAALNDKPDSYKAAFVTYLAEHMQPAVGK